MEVSKADFEFEQIPDESPDLSYLGNYSDRPTSASIDRNERGDQERHQFRYFVPAEVDYAEQSYNRMESLNAGNWAMIGVRATINLEVPAAGGTYSTLHRISSPGVWGVESDSEQSYLDELYAEECNQLADILAAMGIVVID